MKLTDTVKEEIRKLALKNLDWTATDIAEIINAGLPDGEEKIPARMVGVVAAKARNPDRVNKPRKAKGEVEETEEVDMSGWIDKDHHDLIVAGKDALIASLQGTVDKLASRP